MMKLMILSISTETLNIFAQDLFTSCLLKS